jgi:hypothetical protein
MESKMPKQYDVSYLKQEPAPLTSTKPVTNWVKVSVAFENKNGRIQVRLDAQPIPRFWPDQTLVLFPKENNNDEAE